MSGWPPLLALLVQFALLSLISVGGLTAMLPEVHRYVVDVQHWMTSAEFVRLFALAQAAPGPNMIVVSLIGWKVAGLAGALVATVAMCAPSCLLAYSTAAVWARKRDTQWGRAIQRGLTPIAVGLVLASGWLLTEAAGQRWQHYFATMLACGFVLATRWNPIWMILAAGLAGIAGLL